MPEALCRHGLTPCVHGTLFPAERNHAHAAQVVLCSNRQAWTDWVHHMTKCGQYKITTIFYCKNLCSEKMMPKNKGKNNVRS